MPAVSLSPFEAGPDAPHHSIQSRAAPRPDAAHASAYACAPHPRRLRGPAPSLVRSRASAVRAYVHTGRARPPLPGPQSGRGRVLHGERLPDREGGLLARAGGRVHQGPLGPARARPRRRVDVGPRARAHALAPPRARRDVRAPGEFLPFLPFPSPCLFPFCRALCLAQASDSPSVCAPPPPHLRARSPWTCARLGANETRRDVRRLELTASLPHPLPHSLSSPPPRSPWRAYADG